MGVEMEAEQGEMNEAMQALHEEWLQTPRDALEGKKPAEMLEEERKKKFRSDQMKLESMNTTRSHVALVKQDLEYLREVNLRSDSPVQNVKLESGLSNNYLF